MSRASNARRASRRQKAALRANGIAVMDRVVIEGDALAKVVERGADIVDFVSLHVAGALGRLDEQGADIVRGQVAVTLGEHPDFPGALTVEAKASTLKRVDFGTKPEADRAPFYGGRDEDGM